MRAGSALSQTHMPSWPRRYRKAGDKEKAIEELRLGREVSIRLVALSPDVPQWKRDLRWFDIQLAELGK